MKSKGIKRIVSASMALTLSLTLMGGMSNPINHNYIINSISASAASNRNSTLSVHGQNKTFYCGDIFLDNGTYYGTLQKDGNVVVYKRNGNGKVSAVWDTHTYCKDNYKDYKLVFQNDGNIVLYAKLKGTNNEIWVWNSSSNISNRNCWYNLSFNSNGHLNWKRSYDGSSATTSSIWTSDSYQAVFNVRSLKQNDSRWSGKYLYGGYDTIGGAGCALTCFTMVANFYRGESRTPSDYNNSAYVSGGSTRFIGCRDRDHKYNLTYTQIAQELKRGPVVICLERRGYADHFIVVYGCSKRSGTITAKDLRVMDPYWSNGTLEDALRNKGSGSYVATTRVWDPNTIY